MNGLVDADQELVLSLWSQYIDKLTVSVVAEFESRKITPILLKGPAVARWLYDSDECRSYGDADLMVAPHEWQAAQATLAELGFTKELAPLDHPGMASIASEAWVRGADNVDLHCTLWGATAGPDSVWRAVSASPRELELRGRLVRTLAPEAQALLLATHAAKHGDGWAVEDLARGVRQVDHSVWVGAAALAARIGSIPAFVSGLQMVAGGAELVRALGLPETPLPEAELRAWRVPLALGLEHLSRTPGLRNKLRVIAREVWPTPAFLRWWTPLARRGHLGLAIAYLWRMLWIGRHAVPAVLAWRQVHQPSQP